MHKSNTKVSSLFERFGRLLLLKQYIMARKGKMSSINRKANRRKGSNLNTEYIIHQYKTDQSYFDRLKGIK